MSKSKRKCAKSKRLRVLEEISEVAVGHFSAWERCPCLDSGPLANDICDTARSVNIRPITGGEEMIERTQAMRGLEESTKRHSTNRYNSAD